MSNKDSAKVRQKISVFLIIGIAISLIILGIRVLTAENKYITVEIIASGDNWWQTQPKVPYWLADAVIPGAVEYSAGGKKLAEVLEVTRYDEDYSKVLWAKIRLLVTEDKSNNGWKFQQIPLVIGSTLNISPNSVKLTGNVIAIEDIVRSGEYKNLLVTVKLYDRFPWYADAIPVGLQETNDQGNLIVKVLEKKVDLAETSSYTSDGRVLARLNPLKRDITLDLEIQAIERKGLLYYNQIQTVKTGSRLWIQTQRLNLFEAYILDIREKK